MIMVLTVLSCAKDEVSTESQITEVSEEVLAKIRNLGYSDQNIQIINTHDNGIGYVVERDFILHDSDLNLDPKESVVLRIAEVEQYRTTLVPDFRRRSNQGFGQTTIDIAIDDALPAAYYDALRRAATRYNTLGLSFRINAFLLSDRGRRSVEITVRQGSDFAAAGPPRQVTVGRRTTIVPYNEVLVNPGPDGAIPIPGTPTDPESGSWMLACIGFNVNRPFTNNDVVALRYLHSL